MHTRSVRPTSRPSHHPTIWRKPWISHGSPMYGDFNNTANLTMYHDSCPQGSKVVSIVYRTSDWIYQFAATCDDKKNTRLGPWGVDNVDLDLKTVTCLEGYNGWNITYGSYIGLISFACVRSSQSVGRGITLGAGTTNHTNLFGNQSVVGFQLYNDSSGIKAMSIEYAVFPYTGKCTNAIGESTGKCPTTADYLAIVWGFLTVMSLATIVSLIARYKRRRRHKQMFQELDVILPLT